MKMGLIDYGRGNLRSVEKALERAGAEVERVASAGRLNGFDAIVFPGVGAFGDAMCNLKERGLIRPIQKWLNEDKPFLGICLGYQLLFEKSDESPNAKGLGWLPGKVIRFPATVGKVPHMGWNVVKNCGCPFLKDLASPAFFYHVHSYYPASVNPKWVACETEYGGVRFPSGIQKGNACAFQFHPEKSQENGRKLLEKFVQHLA